MSDGDDPRLELVAAARGLRRWLERERAGGAGELVGASIVSAIRVPGQDSGSRASERSAARRAAGDEIESGAPLRAPLPISPPAARLGVERSGAEPTPSGSDTDSLFDKLTTAAPRPGSGGALHPRDPAARAVIDAEARPVLDQIAAEVRACQKCALWQTRTQGVPGVGGALSGIAFVGEGPGADEDRLGEPFVGRAGQLLDKIIEAMNAAQLIPGVALNRQTVFIGNIVHCRPPENRVPLPVEVEQSSPYLMRQLAALKPRVICCLGKTAAEALLGEKSALGAMRGRIYRFMGAKLIVTYHPAACLRNPGYKRPVWEDMQLLAREYLQD